MAIVTTNTNSNNEPVVVPPSIFDIAGRPPVVVRPLNGGNPPEVMLNWNGLLTECSLEVKSGSFKNYGKVTFPIEECIVSFSQDIVQHKRPNVPGARVEGTGFNPIVFKVKAPFLYGLQRGKGETWSNLYPGAFSQIFNMLTDTVSPVLVFTHPTMGQFVVKPQGGTTTVNGSVRNGQVLEFELIQANEDDTNVSNISGNVELGSAESAATIFDSQIVLLTPAPPKNITAISVTKLLQMVRGAIDQTSLFINKVTNVVNYAIHQIKMIEDALFRLKTAATSGLITQLKRVKSGIYSLVNNQSTATPPNAKSAAQLQRAQALASAKTVTGATTAGNLAVYVVTFDMTLANVALLTHNTIDQLIRLNPAVSKSPTIQVGAQIVYQVVNEATPTQ